MMGGRSKRTSQNNGGMHRGMPPSQVRIQDRQQTTAAWNAWSASAPPKNSSSRTCTPKLFAVAPGVISTVAGENGTAVLGEPRVARAAHELTLMSFETW